MGANLVEVCLSSRHIWKGEQVLFLFLFIFFFFYVVFFGDYVFIHSFIQLSHSYIFLYLLVCFFLFYFSFRFVVLLLFFLSFSFPPLPLRFLSFLVCLQFLNIIFHIFTLTIFVLLLPTHLSKFISLLTHLSVITIPTPLSVIPIPTPLSRLSPFPLSHQTYPPSYPFIKVTPPSFPPLYQTFPFFHSFIKLPYFPFSFVCLAIPSCNVRRASAGQ